MEVRNSLGERKLVKIRRAKVVQELLALYSDPRIATRKLNVKLRGEPAVDLGGVLRDTFSSFWECLFANSSQTLFHGYTLKVPHISPLNAASADSTLRGVGCILSHSFLLTGSLPVQLCPVSVASLIGLDVTQLPQEMMIDCFLKFLPPPDEAFIAHALTLESFSTDVRDRLIDFYSFQGITKLPTQASFKEDIYNLARFKLVQEPQYALSVV